MLCYFFVKAFDTVGICLIAVGWWYWYLPDIVVCQEVSVVWANSKSVGGLAVNIVAL